MVDYLPFASSAPRQPDRQKPRPIPADVKAVIHLMVWADDANPDALPPSYREKLEREKLVRVVCDYIAGMTDYYVEEIRNKLLAGKSA